MKLTKTCLKRIGLRNEPISRKQIPRASQNPRPSSSAKNGATCTEKGLISSQEQDRDETSTKSRMAGGEGREDEGDGKRRVSYRKKGAIAAELTWAHERRYR